MQRVASRGSLVTPVATPAESALDDGPAASDSKEIANQTDSITHDEVDERVHDVASPVTGKLTDIGDLVLSLEIQLPNSPKTEEAPQRLTVPVGSTLVDGTIDPLIVRI